MDFDNILTSYYHTVLYLSMLIFAIFMRYLIILLTKATKSYIIYAITVFQFVKGIFSQS